MTRPVVRHPARLRLWPVPLRVRLCKKTRPGSERRAAALRLSLDAPTAPTPARGFIFCSRPGVGNAIAAPAALHRARTRRRRTMTRMRDLLRRR